MAICPTCQAARGKIIESTKPVNVNQHKKVFHCNPKWTTAQLKCVKTTKENLQVDYKIIKIFNSIRFLVAVYRVNLLLGCVASSLVNICMPRNKRKVSVFYIKSITMKPFFSLAQQLRLHQQQNDTLWCQERMASLTLDSHFSQWGFDGLSPLWQD